MSATVLQFSHALATLECGECGITFAAPERWITDRRSDHRIWYCPNGHPRHFPGESKEEKLTRELSEAKKNNRLLWSEKEAMRRRLYAAEDDLVEAKAKLEMMSMGRAQ